MAAQEFQDGRSYDPREVRRITQEWVDAHMKEKESEFTTTKEGTIFCGTWNVNGKKLDAEMGDWLLPAGEELKEIYAIGFQEMVDLNAMNVAIDGGKASQRAQYWNDKALSCLDESGTKFTLIAEKHLVGLLLLIYVKSSQASKVKDVRVTSTGVGLLGMMGNKGGVTVRFNYYDSSLCFVCSHLAAHRGAVSARNADFKAIIDRSSFPADEARAYEEQQLLQKEQQGKDGGGAEVVVRPRHGAEKTMSVDLTILEHDVVFWIGDLNYRIDEELSTDDVFSLIDAGQLEHLRERDQLNIERGRRNVFQDFHEGLLDFPPTYKYQPGTDEYDRRPEKKIRPPAWCDRVLWYTDPSLAGEVVKLHSYRRSELSPSDHKPVSASFLVQLRVIVAEKEKAVYQQLTKQLAAFRNGELPQVEVDVGEGFTPSVGSSSQPLEFIGAKYLVRMDLPYVIRNAGKALAHWRFVNKVEDTRYCKRWLSVSQSSGLLLPGETASLSVSVLVDQVTAQAINTGKERLTDILILRVENSFDLYTPVEVEFLRSCYGVSLEELVCTQEPFRHTHLPAHRKGSDADERPSSPSDKAAAAAGQKLGIPKELWRLVDALWNGKALLEKDLFQAPFDVSEVAAIREALDCGVDFPAGCAPHAYVEALTSFLAALPKPLLPPDLYPAPDADEASQRGLPKRFLDALPPLSYNVFVYTLSFLREVLAQHHYNRTSADKLAMTCISCMAPRAEDKKGETRRLTALRDLLVTLLTTSSL